MAQTIDQSTAQPNVTPVKHPTRFGISLNMGRQAHTLVSPVWSMAGWRLQFVHLAAGDAFRVNRALGEVYVKVVLGSLSQPLRRAYPRVGEVVTTRLTTDVVQAGETGALLSVYTRTASAPAALSSMQQLRVEGPLADALGWTSFEARYSALTPFFNGADAHLVPGFHLLDNDGAEICYVFFWTAGKGVDLSTHNHGNTPNADAPAFAEVHQVLYNGTGQGGMYATPEPGAATRTRLPMQTGEEHGPFFFIDAHGKAKLRENGAVEYPWHGWQAGTDSRPGQSYDLVCAYEITAPYALVT
jgi:Aldos-2-ulose dehydratase/isomerase (AUDH) Cupin domain